MRGVVATGHAEVSAAAAALLRQGGNAFDAAVAAGFAAALAEPMFTSLGGGGFLLARSADGSEVVFDFFVETPGRGLAAGELEPHFVPMTVHFPASDQVFNMGLGSVAVPGTLRGLLHVHERLGRRELSDVVAPAARLAREGVVLNAHQAYVQELLHPVVTLTDAGRSLYAPQGRGLREGERFVNHELAEFLDALPDDRGRGLYEGALGERIARDMRGGQGLLSAEDLAAYRVVERQPLAIEYRGQRLLTNPPPSVGGSLIARSLLLHERWDPTGHGWRSPEHLLALAGVMVEIEKLRSDSGAGGTTHISVFDPEGNAASLSLSNGEGSGYLAPGTGIMLNNMLGEDDLHPGGFHASPPGERVASMMAPSLLLRDGEVRLILGSGGSKRIRTAIFQVITHSVDHGVSVHDAVEAPRLHWDGEQLQVEPGFDDAAIEALRRSWPVNTWSERNLYFGGVHAVDPAAGGAGDPRRGGHGSVVD